MIRVSVLPRKVTLKNGNAIGGGDAGLNKAKINLIFLRYRCGSGVNPYFVWLRSFYHGAFHFGSYLALCSHDFFSVLFSNMITSLG